MYSTARCAVVVILISDSNDDDVNGNEEDRNAVLIFNPTAALESKPMKKKFEK